MLKTHLNKSLSLFFILGFLFIPLTFFGFDTQYNITRFLFLRLVAIFQDRFFPHGISSIDFSSDTIGLNLLLCLLLILATGMVALIRIFKLKSYWINPLFKNLSAWYIAAILLKYGFDKVFKQQFSLPEPNILYSSFGSLNKDILFWSTIGLSHSYSVVTGAVEVLTAILILIRRTRILGYCLAIVVLANVVLINFSFDISVKTFTLFLLTVVVFNVSTYFKTIYAFFVQHKQVQLHSDQTATTRFNKSMSIVLAAGLVCYTVFPYLYTGNFNDDNAERPFLHGAYIITGFTINGQALTNANFPYKRFFIHRNNYLIFQQQNDQMIDYHFEINPAQKVLDLEDYHKNKLISSYIFDEKSGVLKLQFANSRKWLIEAKALNWRALPALQDETHYTIDEIK